MKKNDSSAILRRFERARQARGHWEALWQE
jgi:hypothetical protein